MGVDYNGKISEIVDFLKDHNTTTASPYLSSSLTTAINNDHIFNDDPSIVGARANRYPCLFVSLNLSDEEESQMGEYDTRKAFKTIAYDIHGCFRRPGMSVQHNEVLKDFYQMAGNVEAVIKSEVLDLDCVVNRELTSTDFKSEQPDNSQIKVFKISFNVRYMYS